MPMEMAKQSARKTWWRRQQRTMLGLLPLLIAASLWAQEGRSGFNGRWDLTVHDSAGEYPSWIEVSTEGSHLSVRFVGRIGHARRLQQAEIRHGVLRFTVPADGLAGGTQIYRGVLWAHHLTGHMRQEGHAGQAVWTGQRAPRLHDSMAPQWGPALRIFDGRTLHGWHARSPGGSNWSVRDGVLVTSGRGADLVSDAVYTDLQLHLEWRCSVGANSGVYLRGRYEVQIETDSASEPASHHTGGVYGFLAPDPEQPRRPDAWQSFDLTLVGRQVTLSQNGIVVVDHQEIPGITGGALDSQEGAPGPIVLQGGEDGTVMFRNVVVRRGVSH